MSDLLITGWTGFDHAQMAAHTMPLMRRYADRHGMEKCCVCLSGERPPSWMKVPYIVQALDYFDRVLWIDCDVVIVKQEENILDAVPDGAIQSLVEHDTDRGPTPNCGVWVLTKAAQPFLVAAWDSGRFVTHCWWEQASILTEMGYVVEDDEQGLPTVRRGQPTDLFRGTVFLDQRWNHHHLDRRRSPNPNFLHVTGYEHRVETLTRLCNAAQT